VGYEPSFTFHGFRYAEIDGIPHDTINLEDFTAIVVHTDFERTGTFDSSHKLVNQLYSNVCWGMRGNFLSVPTNCPQRDGSVCSHGVLPVRRIRDFGRLDA
jgi:alpha-L-rhamnosidase